MEEAALSSLLLESAAKMEPASTQGAPERPALWESWRDRDVSQGSQKILHRPNTSIKKQICHTTKKRFHNTNPGPN